MTRRLLPALGILAALFAHGMTARAAAPESPPARIAVPYELEVEQINGEPAAITRRAKRAGLPLELPAGRHTLVLRYYMPRGFDDADPLDSTPERSAPVPLVVEVTPDRDYRIAYTWATRDTLALDLLDEENRTQTPPPPADTTEPAAPAPVTAPAPVAQSASTAAPAVEAASPLTALQQAWQQASEEERRAFRRWIIDAP